MDIALLVTQLRVLGCILQTETESILSKWITMGDGDLCIAKLGPG